MSIQENTTREEFSHRGGGVELELTAYGYEDEYLGGGRRGPIVNNYTVED